MAADTGFRLLRESSRRRSQGRRDAIASVSVASTSPAGRQHHGPWLSGPKTVIGVDRSRGMLTVARRKWRGCAGCAGPRAPSARRAGRRGHVPLRCLEPRAEPTASGACSPTSRASSVGRLFQFDLNTRFMLQWLSTSEKLFRVGRTRSRRSTRSTRGRASPRSTSSGSCSGRLYRKVLVSCGSVLRGCGTSPDAARAGLRLERVTCCGD